MLPTLPCPLSTAGVVEAAIEPHKLHQRCFQSFCLDGISLASISQQKPRKRGVRRRKSNLPLEMRDSSPNDSGDSVTHPHPFCWCRGDSWHRGQLVMARLINSVSGRQREESPPWDIAPNARVKSTSSRNVSRLAYEYVLCGADEHARSEGSASVGYVCLL